MKYSDGRDVFPVKPRKHKRKKKGSKSRKGTVVDYDRGNVIDSTKNLHC